MVMVYEAGRVNPGRTRLKPAVPTGRLTRCSVITRVRHFLTFMKRAVAAGRNASTDDAPAAVARNTPQREGGRQRSRILSSAAPQTSESELAMLRRTCKAMRREINQLKQQSQDQAAANEGADDARKVVNELTSQVCALKLLNAELVEKNKRMRKKQQREEQNAEESRAMFEKLREKYKTLKECYNKQNAKFKKMIQDRNDQDGAKLEWVQNQINKNQEVEQLAAENQHLRRLADEREAQISQLQALIREKDQRIQDHQREVSSHGETKARLEKATRKCAALKQEKEEQMKKVSELKMSVSGAMQQLCDLQGLMQTRLSERARFQETLADMESKCQSIVDMKNSEIERLTSEMQQMREKEEEARENLSAHFESIDNERRQSLDRLRKQITENQQFNQQEIAMRDKKIGEMQQELEIMSASNEQMSSELLALKRENASMAAQTKNLEAKNQALVQKQTIFEDLKKENEANKQSLKQMIESQTQRQLHVANLEQKLIAAQRENDSLAKKHSESQQQLAELNASLAGSSDMVSELANLYHRKIQHIEEGYKRCEVDNPMTAQVQILTEELDEKTKTIEELRSQIERLDSELQESRSNVDHLLSKLHSDSDSSCNDTETDADSRIRLAKQRYQEALDEHDQLASFLNLSSSDLSPDMFVNANH